MLLEQGIGAHGIEQHIQKQIHTSMLSWVMTKVALYTLENVFSKNGTRSVG